MTVILPSDSSSSEQRVLACDVGNSRVKFGLLSCAQASPRRLPTCLAARAFAVGEEIDWPQIAGWLADDVTVGFSAGANPRLADRIRDEWERRLGPVPLHQVTSPPISLRTAVDFPERVGIDRLLNSVAANVIRKPRQPAVIVDSGTATTVDAVDSDGTFLGGAILPGFDLSAKSLHDYTALLPRVTIDELAHSGRSPSGRNTLQAICSGLFWGQVGAVRELISQLPTQMAHSTGPETILVLLTGGGAGLLAEQFPNARLEPHLSLQGLALAATTQKL